MLHFYLLKNPCGVKITFQNTKFQNMKKNNTKLGEYQKIFSVFVVLIIFSCSPQVVPQQTQIVVKEEKVEPVPKVELSKKLLASYPFNGNADDNSGNGNDGIVYGATLTEDRFGNQNSAYSFDGKDDFIEILPNSPEFSSMGDFTMSMWVSFNSFSKKVVVKNHYDRQYIFNGHATSKSVKSNFYSDGFSIFYDWLKNNSELFVGGMNKLGPGSKEIHTNLPEKNKWTHISMVRNGDKLLQYVNGKLVSREVGLPNTLNMNHSLFIGTFGGNNPYFNKNYNYSFNGKVDDVKLYNSALSAEEIKKDSES